MEKRRRLGIDVGNVIRPDGVHFMKDGYLDITPIEGAFEAIASLVQLFGTDDVFLVSACLSEVEDRTMQWFHKLRFFEQTALNPQSTRFCRQRRYKVPICRDLGITDFIDDRIEILGLLTTVRNLYLFNPSVEKPENFEHGLENLRVISSWADASSVVVL